MKTALIIIAAVVIISGGAFALTHGNDNKTTNTSTSNKSTVQSTDTSSSAQTGQTQNAAATITYSDNGFSPNTVTVKAGDTILIKNTSSSPMQFDSDPHPVHTDDPELNVGEIAPGSSGTVKVMTVGTHGYHDHLNPSQTGTIIVQ